MKRLAIALSSIALVYASNLNYGWNLVGVGKDTNISQIFNQNDIISWKHRDGKWEVFTNSNEIKSKLSNYPFFTKINKNEAVWIYKKTPTISKADLKDSYYIIKKENGKWVKSTQITDFNVTNNSITIDNISYKILNKSDDSNFVKVTNNKETLYLVNSNVDNYVNLINLKESRDMSYIKKTPIYLLGQSQFIFTNYGKVTIKDDGIYDEESKNHAGKIVFKNNSMFIRWEDEDDYEYEKYILQDVDLKRGIIKTLEIGYEKEGIWKDNVYFVLNKEEADKIVKNSLKDATKIDPKTLIGKKLYKLDETKWKDDELNVGITGIELTSDSLIRYWGWYKLSNITSSDLENIKKDSCDYNYTVNYNDGKFNISGHDCDGDNEEENNFVYKIDLTNKNVDVNNLGDDAARKFMNRGIEKVKFTKGTAYCTLLWEDCWFDKDAMLEMLNNLNKMPF